MDLASFRAPAHPYLEIAARGEAGDDALTSRLLHRRARPDMRMIPATQPEETA